MTQRARSVLTSLAAATAALTLAAGCSSDDPNATGEGEEITIDEIGFDYPFSQLPIYERLGHYAREKAEAEGMKLSLSNDQSQLEKQIASLNAWAAQGMPAIVTFPMETASAERIAKQYLADGGVWITYGGTMENQSGSINFDDYARGQALAEHAAAWANENLDGEGEAALIIDEGIELGRNRTAGLREHFEKNAPGIEVVAEEEALGPEAGLTAANAILAQHPDVNIILTVSDDTGLGIYKALTEAGRSTDDPDTYIGGMDGNDVVFNYIKEGSIYRASAALSVRANGEAVVDAVLRAAEGEDAEIEVPVVMLDAESTDIDQYIQEHTG